MLDLHLKEQHLLTLLGRIDVSLTTPLSPRPIRLITLPYQLPSMEPD